MDDLATRYYRKICELEQKLNKALKRIDVLEKEVSEKDRVIAVLQERVGELEEENRRLKGNAKKLKDIVFKEDVKQDEKNKRGARKGHKASFRRKPENSRISHHKDVFLSHCPDCHSALGSPGAWTERFSYDIPLPVEPVITRYRIARYRCSHCRKWVQALPSGLVPKSPFSVNLMMLVLHMKYRGRAADDHIQETFKVCYGVHLSDGTVHTILNRASGLFGSHYEAVKQAICSGKYVHADETGWRVEGRNWYAWGFTNPNAVYYTIENTRGGGIPKTILRDFDGIVIRDGYQGYDQLENEHQLCWPHLLRHSRQAAAMENAGKEIITLHQALKGFLRQTRKRHRRCRSPGEREALHRQMTIALERLWKDMTYDDSEAEKIRHWWLEKRHKHLLTFLKHEDVPWENNAAERALRPLVIRRKVAGGSRSERGAEREAVNMSCISTIVKQGKSLFEEIPVIFRSALAGT